MRRLRRIVQHGQITSAGHHLCLEPAAMVKGRQAF
jgi:hypothetical protein